MPLIDTHVHIASHFDPDDPGDSREQSVETPQENALYAAENAYKTLMAGVTTVQSLGNLVDRPLRNLKHADAFAVLELLDIGDVVGVDHALEVLEPVDSVTSSLNACLKPANARIE
ncbi:MAG: hypothetical protein HC794_04865 [Nitrospiraceae bacterium]|nr:hypothetical protein [Nitrospiraceae bacterium]